MVRKTNFTPKILLGPGTFQSRQNSQRDIKITRNVGKISVLIQYINYAYIHCLKKTKDRTILNNCFLTLAMLTPLIILVNSADGIIQYLIRYSGTGECYFRF